MSGIFDQIINYSPPLIVSGTVNYKGTWDASTNNPPLSNPPVASTKGDYYVVSTAGTQFSISFAVGDWIISSGTAWEKVDLTDAVSSVFGRTGAVVGVSTDYSAVGLTNTAIGAANPSTGAFTSLSSSSTTTLNGTTIPASKTLVVTTDKLSALAATTSAELAGVISDETGSGALVFANSPTLVTPALGTPSSGTVTNLTGTASININGTVGATTPSTGVFSALTVNDNSTLGSSNTDTVNFNARVASDINPSADDTYDLGVTGHEWRNLNIDGTANIDSLVADTADINGGTIDGTTVGATTPSTGAFTTLTTLASNGVNTFESAGISSVGLQFRTNSTNRFKIETPSASADLVFYSGGTTEVARLSSTGLAVTGAITAADSSGSFGTISGSYNAGNPFFTLNRIGGTENIAMYADNSTRFTNNNVERVRIDSSGNVGIGTTSPATLFDVTGASGTQGNPPSSGTTAGGVARIRSFNASLGIGSTTGNSMWLQAADATSLGIYYPITLNPNGGNVGIGTLSPGSKLDVNGEIRIGNTVNTVSPTSPNRTITMVIGGTTYYIHAKTTND